MQRQLVFLKTEWMDWYQGFEQGRMPGSFSFVKEKAYGHELFNFKPHRGKYYGFFPQTGGRLTLQRLGTAPTDEKVDGLTVIWVAIQAVSDYFTSEYDVKSVEREYIGWDLEAVPRGPSPHGALKLEVKGTSTPRIEDAAAELTPNEYGNAMKHANAYRICLVVNAATAPRVHVFRRVNAGAGWTDGDGNWLKFEERTGAGISVEPRSDAAWVRRPRGPVRWAR